MISKSVQKLENGIMLGQLILRVIQEMKCLRHVSEQLLCVASRLLTLATKQDVVAFNQSIKYWPICRHYREICPICFRAKTFVSETHTDVLDIFLHVRTNLDCTADEYCIMKKALSL